MKLKIVLILIGLSFVSIIKAQVQVKTTLSSFSVNVQNDSLILVSGQMISGNSVSPVLDHGYLSLRYSSLSISNDLIANWMIFPNPASSNIQVSFGREVSGTIYIYNFLGELVIQNTIHSDEAYLDISGLEAGSYNLVCMLDEQYKVQRFIKL
jgi:hypothetical protein